MQHERPTLNANLLSIKGEAEARPMRSGEISGLSELSQKKLRTVTITYRVEPERHYAIKLAAVQHGLTIQQIIDHALTQIGL